MINRNYETISRNYDIILFKLRDILSHTYDFFFIVRAITSKSIS